MAESFKNLEIWQNGMSIVKKLYKLTKKWPKEEQYGLTSQVRRAAVSIPANIAEGIGRGSSSEAARFAKMSLGSLYELQTLLEIADDLEYLENDVYSELKHEISTLAKRISSFVTYQENKSN